MELTVCFIVFCAIVCATNISADVRDDLTVRSGDIQLKSFVLRPNQYLYKAGPLFVKQKRIQKYCTRRISSDWSGRYYAFAKDVSIGYGEGYLIGNGEGGFILNGFQVKNPFYVLEITNRKFGDAGPRQEIKAQKLKEFFKANGLGNVANQNFPKTNQNLVNKFNELSIKLRREFQVPSVSLVSTLNNVDLALVCPNHGRTNELILPPQMDFSNKLQEVSTEVKVYEKPGEPSKSYPSKRAVESLRVIQKQSETIERENVGLQICYDL